MIKYDLTNINKWYNGSRNIVKCYHGSTLAFDLTGGGAPVPPTPTGQTPCYAVTDDISQYQATDFVDVYDTTADKWYKLNNLNEYEEYGIYGSGRTNTTYYEGKLTIDGDYEYIYSGNSWVNLGEVSCVTTQTVWYDPPSSGSNNANFNIGHYWGENYKMIYTMYLQGEYYGDKGSFWQDNQKSPLEFHFYDNGYYFDLHNPTSTSSPSVNTTDYDNRILKQNVFYNYESGQVMNVTLTYGSLKVELEESGTVIETTGSTKTGYSWYNGLYEPSIMLDNRKLKCHVSRIQVYNASDVLVNDLKFVKNNGVTGSQEISMVDTVLNVVYNNTNENTPCYHVVEEGGGSTVYPEYYDEIAEPPMSLTFATMADALAYQCPYVGLRATIAGDYYIFNSNYEWEEVIIPYVEINGVKWAKMNIGAETETDMGLYFQWGDTSGYTSNQVGSGEGKKYFDWGDYKYATNAQEYSADMTKYNKTDGLTELLASDDAATVNWGSDWRMPTDDEFKSLVNSVNATWVYHYNGSNTSGLLCTDKTDSSKVLFLPAAGFGNHGNLRNPNFTGTYWSNTCYYGNPEQAYYLMFDSEGFDKYVTDIPRFNGYSIRPVHV